MPGPKEWFLIFLVILLIFGAKRIPEIMRALGRGLGEFRKAREDFEKALHEPAPSDDNASDTSQAAASTDSKQEAADDSEPSPSDAAAYEEARPTKTPDSDR